MIKRLLIANRGEIAVRIIRTCKEMSIETVAVYSTADESSLHVQLADIAKCIGGPRSTDSYLNMENIISVALLTNCDAIHPGFGFLSESSRFANLVEECGLIFVGPHGNIIDQLGDKAAARKLMMEANVPVVPGSKEIVEDVNTGKTIAAELGYPVLIKASSGGGGKGMRLAPDEASFEDAFFTAKSEAEINFNDGRVYIEKFIEEPKHVEIQVIGDDYGNVVHLFERDCSMQRRNQKIIEEAPCHILKQEVREKMCADAIKACKSVNYNSVGTIEFLLDKYQNYYFIEMNTRIQVEHPITEMVTGVDLIKLQIRVADHQHLPIKQSDIQLKGCAMECRINAEDMQNDFRATPGKIERLYVPGGRGIRIDSAAYTDYVIPPYYDSMILKLITYGDTRLECIKKMRRALEELIVDGIDTNIEFHYYIMHHPKFVEGKFDTSFTMKFIEELKNNGTII
ncbi:MAG: acetyl-CoA carboxylase biotin carboxylase subunit [Erysipelotrichaceae bacterium]